MPKPKTVEVFKPVLTGSWHGKDAFRQGLKLMLSVLFVSVIYLVLSLLLSFDALALRIVAGAVLVGAAVVYLFYNGMSVGQTDAAFAEIMYQRQAEGKPITAEDQARCFHPAKGFMIAFIGVLPYLLLALAFALMTRPVTYTLGILPGWLTSYTRQSGIGDALAYYQTRDGINVLAILRVVVRGMAMPFIGVAVKLGDTATLWAERLSPLWVMIAPLGFGFGYRQGLRVRARIHGGILLGDQKKRRKEKRDRRARNGARHTGKPERLI